MVAGGGADAGDDVAGATRLCAAAAAGDLTLVERLVRAGVAVDAADYDRRTALHIAAAEGYEGIVEDLLARGARPNPASVTREQSRGSSPLQKKI